MIFSSESSSARMLIDEDNFFVAQVVPNSAELCIFAGLQSRGLTIETGLTIKYLRHVRLLILENWSSFTVIKNCTIIRALRMLFELE